MRNSKIEAVVKNLLAQKIPGLDDFTGEFYQTFKEDLTSIFLKLYQKFQEEWRFPNSLYEASIIKILKHGKDTTKKENYR